MTFSLLTVKDMATRLQVKDKTVYAWASQGKIPCIKINGAIRFDPGEIEQWLQQCHVPIGPPRMPKKTRRKGSATNVDHLIESAKRSVYTSHGGNPTSSEPIRKGVSEWGS